MGSLTHLQRSLIIGTVLGDGYLRIVPKRKNAFLEINHSLNQREYVDWKYSILQNIAGSKPKIRKGNGKRMAYRFYTRQNPEITEIFRRFYRNGIKIIPDDLTLDAVSLAVWFMDDGSKCSPSSTYINTQQYNLEDQKRLILKLRNLGLIAGLNRDKEYWRLRFAKSSLPKLHSIISSKVIPSMRYKVSCNPRET